MALCMNCLNPDCDGKGCWLNKHLFVYGTLKKGHGNSRLLEAATFIGPAVSLGTNFVMDGIRVNEVDPPALAASVKGELYLVPTIKEWLRLDRLESHPHVYRRKVRTFVTEDGRHHDAWIYMFEPEWYRGDMRLNPAHLNAEGQLEF